MQRLKFLPFLLLLMMLLGSSCPTFEPPPPPLLHKPAITGIALAETWISGTYAEAVHLKWAPLISDSLSVKHYTIIRKFPGDSAFDIFPLSRQVPDTLHEFFDRIYEFPRSQTRDTLYYRIFATDSFGRSGDTSEPYHILLTVQPSLDTFDFRLRSIAWSSSGIQGHVQTWVRLWNDDYSVVWTSDSTEDYPGENTTSRFSARLPDTLVAKMSGRKWWAGLNIVANAIEYSIKTTVLGEL